MTISRSQMTKQVEGQLRGAKKEKKKEKDKIYVKKSNKKSALSRTFTVQPKGGTIEEVVQPKKA